MTAGLQPEGLPNARLLLLGDDRIVSVTAAHWLQERGLHVIENSQVRGLLRDRRTLPLSTGTDSTGLAELGKRAGAQWVVVTSNS